jgi:hypothetical protein
MTLEERIETRTMELAQAAPSQKVARFVATREVLIQAIDEAKTMEDVKAVLRIYHQKIYS